MTIEALTDLNDEDTGFSIQEDFLGFTLLACPYFDTECGTDEYYQVSGFGIIRNIGENATMSTGSAPLGGGYVHLRSYIGQFGSGPTTENLEYQITLSSSTSQSSGSRQTTRAQDQMPVRQCSAEST